MKINKRVIARREMLEHLSVGVRPGRDNCTLYSVAEISALSLPMRNILDGISSVIDVAVCDTSVREYSCYRRKVHV